MAASVTTVRANMDKKEFKSVLSCVIGRILLYLYVLLTEWIQCDAIRLGQIENSHEYGRVGVFRIQIRSLVQKFQKCQFSNCSHLVASHCM